MVFAFFLYFACAALIVAEVFVPSGGILSICAFACAAGGVLIFFKHSTSAGVAGIVVAVVMVPSLLVLAYRVFPRTRFGRVVTLTPPQRAPGDAIADSDHLKELLGAEGVVITPLRPVGTCDFSGKRVECVAEQGYVEKSERVKVIRVQSTQVTVRVVKREDEMKGTHDV